MQNNDFRIKPNKYFWVFILTGLMVIGLGSWFCYLLHANPLFGYGIDVTKINLTIFVLIILYIAGGLCFGLRQEDNQAMQVIRIIEIIVFAFLGITCLLSQFNSKFFIDPNHLVGICFLTRGIVVILKAYFKQVSEDIKIGSIITSIFLIAFGAMLAMNSSLLLIFSVLNCVVLINFKNRNKYLYALISIISIIPI